MSRSSLRSAVLLLGLVVLLAAAAWWLGPLGQADDVEGPPEHAAPASNAAPLVVPPGAQPFTVVWHADGDTLRVRATGPGPLPQDRDTSVRLLEIDAPEEGTECFADEATVALQALLPTGSRGYAVPDRELQDRYGRELRYLWNDAGVFVNERLVHDGFATAVLFRPNDLHIERMRAAEQDARGRRSGLWGACAGGLGAAPAYSSGTPSG